MDRTIAVFESKKYKAYISRGNNKISTIRLSSHMKENGFTYKVSPYDKNLYVKEVTKEDITELYREYFVAKYKSNDFFVITDNKMDRKIQILTADSNIGRECGLDREDRDLFTKWLRESDEYQLFYIKENYLHDEKTRKEITLAECFEIDDEKFR